LILADKVRALELLMDSRPTCAADENGEEVVVRCLLVLLREFKVNSTPDSKATLSCLHYQPGQERELMVVWTPGLRWLRGYGRSGRRW